jgi:hypothetical protein
MPRVINLQTSFNSGVLDPRLAARTDLKHFYQGAAEAENVQTLPQGGMKRRPGFRYIDTINAEARLAPFAFNVEQTYLLVFTNNNIAIYKDDVKQADVATTYATTELFNLQWTQSADTMIIVHENHPPAKLVRGSTHASWTLSDITIVSPPQYTFDTVDENVWSAARGWPKSVTFYQGRMWFGGSKSRPQTLWGSKTNDFYNFDLGTSLDDESLDLTLDTDQVNAITSVYAGRHLQVFTTGGEFSMTDIPLTPSKSAVKRQTLFGSSNIPPKSIDGATLFVDRTGKSVREYLFNYAEDAYTSGTVSLLASHLLNSPVDMDALRGTAKDDANYVYFVNADGTVAVFNTLRAQEVGGWTRWTTDGQVEGVTVVVEEVYFIVKRTINGSVVRYLERLDSNTYTDACATTTLNPIGLTVTGLDHLEGETCRARADGSVLESVVPVAGEVTLSRDSQDVEIGLNYNATIKTMPINQDFQDGPTLTRKKRIVRVIANLYESLGVSVNGEYMVDRSFGMALGSAVTPYTGIKEMYLLGWTDLAQVSITQIDPGPMTVLGLGVEVEA